MKRIILLIVIFLSGMNCFSQDNTGSPYSAYGIGLMPENNGPYSAMGGVGAAMRDNNNINFLNPASYTALDTNRFHFQFSMAGEYTHIATHKESANYRVAQNTSLNMAFRLYKTLYGSFGFNEKSDVGYDLLFTEMISGDESQKYNQHIQGEGGLNELYLGLGWRYKNLSIGLNSSLLFGKLEKRETLQASLNGGYYINTSNNIRVTAPLFTGGLQYFFNLSPKSQLTLGTAFSLNTKLHAKREYISYKVNSSTGNSIILDDETLNEGSLSYPFSITGGFNYSYKERWNLAGDYSYQQMSSYKEFRKDPKFLDYHKAAIGVSYLPERHGRFWWQKNKYMLGSYFARSYVDLKNTPIRTYAFTFGTQMPFETRNGELILGVSFDFGIRGTEQNGLIQEKFGKLRINIAFKEGWFMKRKIN